MALEGNITVAISSLKIVVPYTTPLTISFHLFQIGVSKIRVKIPLHKESELQNNPSSHTFRASFLLVLYLVGIKLQNHVRVVSCYRIQDSTHVKKTFNLRYHIGRTKCIFFLTISGKRKLNMTTWIYQFYI